MAKGKSSLKATTTVGDAQEKKKIEAQIQKYSAKQLAKQKENAQKFKEYIDAGAEKFNCLLTATIEKSPLKGPKGEIIGYVDVPKPAITPL